MAKNIMIQGTMSNAGKSLITAGLLRVLKQDGHRAAPFKSQNMALNSFITREGLEMGRAQVMQAEAAGILPGVNMNPILLKPVSEEGTQVIVNGEVLGNMTAREYFRIKRSLVPDIQKAYDKLAQEYDYIVIEGAGSPAEINLKQEDIVNMGMARLVDAPVLLVGDIDRGGVFAQLVGTLMLLEEEERQRIKGLIINKFRGDKTILEPGIAMLYERCRVPITGVLPFLPLDIDDEDSLSERFAGKEKKAAVQIKIIRLPHISNFTDFNPLERMSFVSVTYVSRAFALEGGDMIIIPGTKNTMEDLMWLRQNGMEPMIKRLQDKGAYIMGICGGYQMLGKMLYDPDAVEAGGVMEGMNLLPVVTVFEKKKTRTQIRGAVNTSGKVEEELRGAAFEGYEIHMGRTERAGEVEAFSVITNEITGEAHEEGSICKRVMGTYVHGLFDSVPMQEAIGKLLCRKGGLPFAEGNITDTRAYKEAQYDKLAQMIRTHMDMEAVYAMLER